MSERIEKDELARRSATRMHSDERCEQLAIVDVRNPDVENEQGDHNRKDSITEGFDPNLFIVVTLLGPCLLA